MIRNLRVIIPWGVHFYYIEYYMACIFYWGGISCVKVKFGHYDFHVQILRSLQNVESILRQICYTFIVVQRKGRMFIRQGIVEKSEVKTKLNLLAQIKKFLKKKETFTNYKKMMRRYRLLSVE